MPQKSDDPLFRGFRQPKANYSKLPHQFVAMLPQFKSLAELKVIIYLLRHTWGYREYEKSKLISIDEFVNGRKRKNGERMDGGTGLSEQGVRDGLETAISNGYILCQVDDSDKGRVKKFYKLNTAKPNAVGSGVQSLDPQSFDLPPQTLDPTTHKRGTKSVPRTEKETKERNSKKETGLPNGKAPRVTPHYEHYLKLLMCYGFDDATMPKSKKGEFLKVAAELHRIGIAVEQVASLFGFVANMARQNDWKQWTVNSLEKYAPEFLAQRTNGNGRKFTAQEQTRIEEYAKERAMTYEEAEREIINQWGGV